MYQKLSCTALPNADMLHGSLACNIGAKGVFLVIEMMHTGRTITYQVWVPIYLLIFDAFTAVKLSIFISISQSSGMP